GSRAGSPVDPSPSGVSVLDAVPELDRVLADAPAEKDVLAVPDGREVEQAGVGILQLHPHQRQFVDDLLQLAREVRKLGRPRIADAFAASVAGDDANNLPLLI